MMLQLACYSPLLTPLVALAVFINTSLASLPAKLEFSPPSSSYESFRSHGWRKCGNIFLGINTSSQD